MKKKLCPSIYLRTQGIFTLVSEILFVSIICLRSVGSWSCLHTRIIWRVLQSTGAQGPPPDSYVRIPGMGPWHVSIWKFPGILCSHRGVLLAYTFLIYPEGRHLSKWDSVAWCQESANPGFRPLWSLWGGFAQMIVFQGLHFFFCIPLRLPSFPFPPPALWPHLCFLVKLELDAFAHTENLIIFDGIAPMEFTYKSMKMRTRQYYHPWKLGDLPFAPCKFYVYKHVCYTLPGKKHTEMVIKCLRKKFLLTLWATSSFGAWGAWKSFISLFLVCIVIFCLKGKRNE